jgi:hypothetical protein
MIGATLRALLMLSSRQPLLLSTDQRRARQRAILLPALTQPAQIEPSTTQLTLPHLLAELGEQELGLQRRTGASFLGH